MNYHINVANIKSSGCANTIRATLDSLEGVHETVVNITNGAVLVEANNGIRDVLSTKLLQLGYPEATTSKMRNSFATKAKSFISCIKGRLRIG